MSRKILQSLICSSLSHYTVITDQNNGTTLSLFLNSSIFGIRSCTCKVSLLSVSACYVSCMSYCLPVSIYTAVIVQQKSSFLILKILSLAVDASPGYHISGDEGKVWTAHGNSRLSRRVWCWPRWLVNLLGACQGVLCGKRHWRQSSQETWFSSVAVERRRIKW